MSKRKRKSRKQDHRLEIIVLLTAAIQLLQAALDLIRELLE